MNETEFYEELAKTLIEYNITEEDTCTRDGRGGLVKPPVVGGIDACKAHLDESFALEEE